MTYVSPEDFEYQKIPVPSQLRNESFMRLNSEPDMLHPTQEAVDRWNSWHPHNPETVDTFPAALKRPYGAWKAPQYRFTADAIDRYRVQSHFRFGNYGIVPVTLAIWDVDNVELMEKEHGVMSSLPDTYRIRSGRISPTGNHVYLKITNIPKDHPFYQNKVIFAGDRGDIRFPGHCSYILGPYSMHPSGRRYLPVPGKENTPVASIEFDDLLEIIHGIPVKDEDNTVMSLEEKIALDKKREHLREEARRRLDNGEYGSNVWYHMIELYNADHPVLDMLTGYEKIGSRLKSPESSPTTGPGVVVIYHNGAEKVLNHHADDTYLNQGDGKIPTSSYDLLIKDKGKEEARKLLVEYIRKNHYDVYTAYKDSCRSYSSRKDAQMQGRFFASLPEDPTKVNTNE